MQIISAPRGNPKQKQKQLYLQWRMQQCISKLTRFLCQKNCCKALKKVTYFLLQCILDLHPMCREVTRSYLIIAWPQGNATSFPLNAVDQQPAYIPGDQRQSQCLPIISCLHMVPYYTFYHELNLTAAKLPLCHCLYSLHNIIFWEPYQRICCLRVEG